jgi:N-acetylmuramoyl-L-alanine amidase
VKGTRLAHTVSLSPNIDERRDGVAASILLLHYTGMHSAEVALKRLCDPQAKVSSHYLVHEDGRIVQMVDEDKRAWHAGISSWRGITDINSHSIGIEIHNVGHNGDYPKFGNAQMDSVVALCADILARNDIRPENVLAHSDVAPGRKTDPGEKFDWQMLWHAGIGHWVAAIPVDKNQVLKRDDAGDAVRALQQHLVSYGYGLSVTGQFDEQTHFVVEAFQRHFRPARVDGIADQSTQKTLTRLLATLPAVSADTV